MKLVLAGADADVDVETKRAKGSKGQFRVASRGLGLHLCTVLCEGPCLQYTLWCRLSLHDLSSSLVIVEQQALAIPT